MAAGLFGNIGVKVLYNNILIDLFHIPSLVARKSKIIYAVRHPKNTTFQYLGPMKIHI
jgi:hypothetical protein